MSFVKICLTTHNNDVTEFSGTELNKGTFCDGNYVDNPVGRGI